MSALWSAESAGLDYSQLACSTCRREIPLSAALTPEGEQYTEYFCGLDCYETYFHKQMEIDYGAVVSFTEAVSHGHDYPLSR